ncbi:MAG TPA: ATP-grasp domain-containing protein [Phycisphaerae bacterium]|nr:ATP-grasp domain-containing protein [Phycisphaerae bacterium]
MATPVLILPPRYTPDSIALWHAATRAGWRSERLQQWRVPDWLHGERCVIYGEPLFAHAIAPELGVRLIEPDADWLVHLPPACVRRDVRCTTLGEARTVNTRSFFKCADEKSFLADVYACGNDIPNIDVLPADTLVLVAEPVRWEQEFRCFVRERTLEAISIYIRDGEVAEGREKDWPATEEELAAATDYCQSLLADPAVHLPAALVIDVGIMADRGWAVVEANPAWGSGVCSCSVDAVLRVIETACPPQDA